MQSILISCGGTGGHLAPGIALAEGLAARGRAATLLVSPKQIDARLAAKYPDLEFIRLPGAPFSLRPAGLARFLGRQTQGFACGLRLIRTRRPAAVVGFGGFTTAAIILAAVLHGVPVALHEANRVPGRAIRLFARLAWRVYLPPGVGLRGVAAAALRPAGLPVRREIVRQPRAAACAALGLDPARRVLLVLGGSQGATPLNAWMRAELPALADRGIQLYGVTGPGKGGEELLTLPAADGQPVVARFVPFSDRMATLLSAADLVVSRAGAGTIAELIRCEVPAVLVPYPQAADDHQRANAGEFVRQGGGCVLAQSGLEQLGPLVRELIFDEDRLGEMRAALRRQSRLDPLTALLDDLETLGSTGVLLT